MIRRTALLVSLLILILVSSCQQSPQPGALILPSTTISVTQSAGSTHISQVIASTATFTKTPGPRAEPTSSALPATGVSDPLTIAAMRAKIYPGSNPVIERTLPAGNGFNRYIVSYQSDGLKLFGLLTIPLGTKPTRGWPVILLNHGYIPPNEYSTDQSYARIINPLAKAGYIVFKPDYRGHGSSEGTPYQVYVSPDYVTDSMNALASIKNYPDANPEKIGVWGHSMGGDITLHELVISKDIKAAVIMAGVVGSCSGIIDWWSARVASGVLTTQNDLQTDQLVIQMVSLNGTPQTNPAFWNAIDPTYFISDIEAPVQIQVGSADMVVPPKFSQELNAQLQNFGKTVTFHLYPGADHNLAPDTTAAMAEAVTFFNKYLK